jgi:hypothetical protein
MAGSFAEPWPCPVSGPLLMETVEPGASLSTLPRAGLVLLASAPFWAQPFSVRPSTRNQHRPS